MPVNLDKPHLWKLDTEQSIDMYNAWFMRFAPQAYREQRSQTTDRVKSMLEQTAHLTNITPSILRQYPEMLSALRMTTAPPIARDRLIGLAQVTPNLVKNMEIKNRLPPKISTMRAERALMRIGQIIMQLADRELLPWLNTKTLPTEQEMYRAATVVADRLCGAATDPIVRNAQEARQLSIIKQWLENRGYYAVLSVPGATYAKMPPGAFAQRLNVPGQQEDGKEVNIPIDMVIMPLRSAIGDFPLLIEAKSAGDFTNTNKRRKEEANKIGNLRRRYGSAVRFVLFLCGYFDSSYLGFEAAEGIDWVWEHRVDDLAGFGV